MSLSNISVIIPTYNRAKMLCRAVQSVLDQTLLPLEIIVIDDGSTDDTEILISAYPVIYIKQKNAGPSAARNHGMRMAKGDFISFLDSDDVWDSLKLERQFEFIKTNNLDFTFCDCREFRYGRLFRRSLAKNSKKNSQLTKQIFNFFEILIRTNPVATPCVLFKKSCLQKTGFFDEKMSIAEDRDLWIRFARNFKCGFLDEILVSVHRQDSNLILDRKLTLQNRKYLYIKLLNSDLSEKELKLVSKNKQLNDAKLLVEIATQLNFGQFLSEIKSTHYHAFFPKNIFSAIKHTMHSRKKMDPSDKND